MSRKIKVINFVVSLLVAVLSVYLISVLSAERFVVSTGKVLLFYVLGVIISAFICAFIHELGHLIGAKISGFKIASFTVWFFRWKKVKNKFQFSLCFPNDTGYTESYPTVQENLQKKFAKITRLGLIFSVIPILFCLPAFLISSLPFFMFAVLTSFLPIGAYSLTSNAIPLCENGVRNDGAVLYGIKHSDDTSKVMFALLNAQALMYQGKTFKELDESLLFDLPQLIEDDLNFAMLLSYRYYYYLDKKDYKNARKNIDRLLSIKKYIPKDFYCEILAESLFFNCAIELNEDKADDLMYENEKYLNSVNNSTTIRAKLAYISLVKGEKENFELFYKKGLKEAKLQQLAGLKAFELSLLELIKSKSEQI
jgi:hypothetical protein